MKLAIYGSCVSRDAVETLPAESYDLTRYVARSSLLSAGTDARAMTRRFPKPSSEFQARQLEWDASGRLEELLGEAIKDADLLLWDLTDERHGVLRFPDGTYLTRTVDIMSSSQLKAICDEGQLIRFGADEHFVTWSYAADRFVDWLRRRDILDRTLVLAVPWAVRLTDGSPTPSSMGTGATEANAAYARYYGHLRDLGLAVRTLSSDSVLGDPQHRWGPAPFHYAAPVYAEIRQAIWTHLEQRGHSQPTSPDGGAHRV